jgi:Fe-S-cluster containining protein
VQEERTESQLIIADWKSNGQKNLAANKIFLKRLSQKKIELSQTLAIHEEVFEKINCLDCGNCCKTAHPIFTKTDVARISDFVGMKISLFENQYLKSDADGDLVPNQLPCPFLNTDNTCQVYEVRPKSCRSFPHTHSKEGWERNNLLTKNTITCPAAFRIVEKMRTGRG